MIAAIYARRSTEQNTSDEEKSITSVNVVAAAERLLAKAKRR